MARDSILLRAARCAAALTAVLHLQIGAARADDEAAHALAQKFSGAEKSPAQKSASGLTETDRKAYKGQRLTVEPKKTFEDEAKRLEAEEAEMLERARIEAEERRRAMQRAAAKEEEEERRREAEARRKAEEERRAEELRLAEEKRKADEARLAEEKRLAEEARLAAEREAWRKAEEERFAEEARLAAEKEAEAKRLAEERQRALEAEREKEARRLVEKIKRVNEERAKRQALAKRASDPHVLRDAAPMPETGFAPQKTVSAPSGLGRVTVLLAMEPGTTGIRRYGEKTADPVLCAGHRCWIGSGADEPATAMSRGRTLGPGNTLGRRAGACNRALTCVYRNVDLGDRPQALQPVDLRIVRHDRREPVIVSAANRCTVAKGRLHCADTVRSRSWRAWIVPEDLADEAGPEALLTALKNGLFSPQAAGLSATVR